MQVGALKVLLQKLNNKGMRRRENVVACNIWLLVLWVIWSSKLFGFIGWQTEAELFKHPMVCYKTAADWLFFLKCCKFVCRKMCVFLFIPSAGTPLPGSSGKARLSSPKRLWKLDYWFPLCYVVMFHCWNHKELFWNRWSRMKSSKTRKYCIWELFIGKKTKQKKEKKRELPY